MITAELRRAILTATGLPDADPLLRPGPGPGRYASSLPFRLARRGQDPREVAADLAARLGGEPWIEAAQATGAGYLTVTVTHDALAGLAVRVTLAGPACAASDSLRGRTVPAAPPPDLAAEPGWPHARAALAAHLTARLAATAGATLTFYPERAVVHPPRPLSPLESLTLPEPCPSQGHLPSPMPFPPAPPQPESVAVAVAYAGADAVRFALAGLPPGGAAPQAAIVARHVLGNSAYAVRYAHAAAAAVLRWAAALGTRPAGPQEFRPRLLAEPGELALLDALSWLPERVAVAARRGRPDEFAGYLEGLATRTIDTMSTTSFRNVSDISNERLWLAAAVRTGLAAGLDLLGVSAPERL
ncbi:MAG: DALR anticodon-binding domain-containing protein [Streptosporangiaceae bacterium]